MTDFLTKLLSKVAFQKGAEIIAGLPKATTPAEGAANHAEATEKLYAFVEELDDDLVQPIPFIGPFLAAFVDTPEADAKGRELCGAVVELIYRSQKYIPSVGGTS